MDKRTIIGLVLIGAILIGYSIINRPSKEELAEQKRINDSIVQVHKNDSIAAAQGSRTEESATSRRYP